MYELIKIKGDSYYIESPVKVGLVKTEAGAVIIDSGNDRSAGKKIKGILEGEGLRLKAIYNTHSHADHIGGNKYLQDNTGCKIYAPGMECAYTRHPILEPISLFGANPPAELRHKFLLAEPSDAEPLTKECLPTGFEIIQLGGHMPDMVGFKTADGVAFLGDSLSSEATLAKYKIGYIHDIKKHLETLQFIRTIEADFFVPSHTDILTDITPLAELNTRCILELGERITDLCSVPLSFDEILAKVFEVYELPMRFEQHALVGSTVRSYLTWLSSEGKIAPITEKLRIVWQRK